VDRSYWLTLRLCPLGVKAGNLARFFLNVGPHRVNAAMFLLDLWQDRANVAKFSHCYPRDMFCSTLAAKE
jgi:hypothetical protein